MRLPTYVGNVLDEAAKSAGVDPTRLRRGFAGQLILVYGPMPIVAAIAFVTGDLSWLPVPVGLGVVWASVLTVWLVVSKLRRDARLRRGGQR